MYALILAGGRGYRLWPKTLHYTPKPFLRIGGRSLLQMTADRAATVADPENVFIVATADNEGRVKADLPELPAGNIFLEPLGRDTAASMAYACAALRGVPGDGVLVMLPSDHYIGDRDAWTCTLSDACQVARGGAPVLIGITPARPEPQYGYIVARPDVQVTGSGGATFFAVERFVEKPTEQEACRLIRDTRCFWNGGMVVCRVDVMRELLRRFLPATMRVAMEVRLIQEAGEGGAEAGAIFESLTPVSLDRAVLEKTTGLVVVQGDFRWDDVGSWVELGSLMDTDAGGNATIGNALLSGCSGCVVDCEGSGVIVIGVKDVVISLYGGRLLCASKDRLGELKDLARAFESRSPTPKERGDRS